LFAGLAGAQASNYSAGLLRASGMEGLPLAFAANRVEANRVVSQRLYKMGVDMRLVKIDDREADRLLREEVKIPQDVISSDDASIVFIDEDGTRYRLPVGERALLTAGPLGHPRTDREVCTERDLFQCGGLFYELPARNAGGFAKVRPITTHNRRLFDYCSWRGLMVISGVDTAESDNPHIIRSEDGEAAVWVGTIDDLWQFGKAVGVGGPWMNTVVKANQPSDAYLFNGFDQRTLTVRHDAAESVTVGIEIDIQGTGDWQPYKPLRVPAGEEVSYSFPAALHGYWIRTVTDLDCVATAQLEYR
jgi:hypothetical protein